MRDCVFGQMQSWPVTCQLTLVRQMRRLRLLQPMLVISHCHLYTDTGHMMNDLYQPFEGVHLLFFCYILALTVLLPFCSCLVSCALIVCDFWLLCLDNFSCWRSSVCSVMWSFHQFLYLEYSQDVCAVIFCLFFISIIKYAGYKTV